MKKKKILQMSVFTADFSRRVFKQIKKHNNGHYFHNYRTLGLCESTQCGQDFGQG